MVRRGSLAPPGHYAPLGPALRVNSKALNCFLQHESEGGNHDAATALASRSTLAKRQPPYGFFTATAATHAPTHAAHSRQSCVTLPPIDDWDGRDPFERSGLSSSTTSTTSCSTTDRPRSAGFFGWLHSRHTQALETHEAAERSELTAIEYDVRDIVLTALAMSVSLGASESVSRYNLCIAERVGFDRITDRGAATRKAVHLLLYNQNSALILFFSALRKYAFDAVRKRRLLRQYDALHGASEVALRCRTLRVLGRYAERCVAMRQLRAALVEEETTQRGVVTAAEAEASSYERYIIRDAKTFLWMTNCRIISVIKTGYSGAVEIREEEALCYAELCGRTTVMQQETDENKVVAFAQEQQRRRTAAMEALSGVSTLSLLTLKYGAWCKWHQLRFNPSTGKGRSKMMALKSTKRILRRWYEVLLSRVMRVRLRAKQSAFALELLFTTETRRLQLAFNTLRLYSFREKAVSLLQHTDQMHLAIFYRKLRRYRRRTDEEIIEDRVCLHHFHFPHIFITTGPPAPNAHLQRSVQTVLSDALCLGDTQGEAQAEGGGAAAPQCTVTGARRVPCTAELPRQDADIQGGDTHYAWEAADPFGAQALQRLVTVHKHADCTNPTQAATGTHRTLHGTQTSPHPPPPLPPHPPRCRLRRTQTRHDEGKHHHPGGPLHQACTAPALHNTAPLHPPQEEDTRMP